jgi:hypothetical protein
MPRDDSVWYYPAFDEIRDSLAMFPSTRYQFAGFFATFGRNEWQRTSDLIEAMLLLPENLFYNTTAPGIVLVVLPLDEAVVLVAEAEEERAEADRELDKVLATYDGMDPGGG